MTPSRRILPALVPSLFFLAVHSTGLAAPDPVAGREFAQKACVNCHVVTEDESFTATKTRFLNPHTQGPDFSTIAAFPGNTAETLRAFLMTTHRDVVKEVGMPNPVLANYQIENVISFILSLREDP